MTSIYKIDSQGRIVTSQGSFNFILSGDSGSDQTVDNGETAEFAGGAGIGTVLSATNTVTINSVWNYEEILGSSGAFDVTISSLTGYTSAKSMIVEFLLRGTVSATTDNGRISFNADETDANYYLQRISGDNGAAGTAEGATRTVFANLPANTSPTNSFAGGRIYIKNPLGSQNKICRVSWEGLYDSAAMRTDEIGYTWLNTSAITSIRIRTDGHPTDLFATGSFIRIKFIK